MARRKDATNASSQSEAMGASKAKVSSAIESTTGSVSRPHIGSQDDEKGDKRPARALAPDLLRGLLNLIMAFDHTALALRIFQHGTGLVLEADGQTVRAFNKTQPYILRSLTHLCGPGFTFLMGMGVVYLVESRLRLGWNERRIVKYLAERTGVLTFMAVFMGLVGTKGQIWLFNMVMFSLAVDYFVSGVFLLVIRRTERSLSKAFIILASMNGVIVRDDEAWAKTLSRRIHNAVLLVISVAMILSNNWFSPNNGHCLPEDVTPISRSILGYPITHPWLQMWFWPVKNREAHIMSAFPPLAWLSFSTLGILYGRILSAKPRSRSTLIKSYTALAAGFASVFVLTRIFNVGNLSEGCLQTPEHTGNPTENQYMVSWKSFFYIVKYTPDIAFWSLTMSGNFFLLALLDSVPLHLAKRLTLLTDLGTSALFYYIVHLIVIFSGGGVVVELFGEATHMEDPMEPGVPKKGFKSMTAFWTAWGILNLLMWPLCRWFSRFKQSKPAGSVWRLF